MKYRCTDETAYFTSEPMRITGKPMFKPQVYSNREFDPAAWHKDECNFYRVDILNPGPVAVDGWEYETVHVPVGFYGTFNKFAEAFKKAVSDGITKIFSRTAVHPVTSEIPKYSLAEYKSFQMTIFQRFRALKSYHAFLEEYDNDAANCLKVLSGGSNNDIYSQLFANTDAGQAATFIELAKTLFNGKFERTLRETKWSDEVGEYIGMTETHEMWVTLSKYVKEGYSTVAALSIVEAFAKDTNFSMKINRRMQYQLGFTINSLFDMGWVRWYERKETLETTKIPSLYWYGYDSPNISNNPLKSMCVHCDIIDGSYVGKSKKSLLRVLPVNVLSHLVTYESFAALQYKHINKNNVSAISIWITETPDGDPIELRSAVFLKLQLIHNG